MSQRIVKIVAGTLLALSIYGIATHAIDWSSDKSPWNKKQTQIAIMAIIGIIAALVLLKCVAK
jgi:hypothetical protein